MREYPRMLERLTRLAAARPRRTLAVAFAFVILAAVVGGPIAAQLESAGGFTAGSSESSRASRQLERATGEDGAPGIALLVRGPGRENEARAREVARELAALPGMARAETVAVKGNAAVISGTARAGAEQEDVVDAVLAAFEADPAVTVGGAAVANAQLGETVSEDLARAELLAFPLLLVLSLVFFRGRATFLPLIAGVTTVLGTFLVLTGVNQVYGLNIFALNLVIGLGLGLAIDYTLFLVTRFREELGRGAETAAAVRTTMLTAGRTVVFSAATVAAALATLTLFPLGFAQSMGIAGASVAVVAALATLTVSPALFALWGRKLLRRKDVGAAAAQDRWHRLAHRVMRRPGLVAATTAVIMLAVALPALGAHWTPVDASAVPPDKSARVVSDAIEREFGGVGAAPITVAVAAPTGAAGEVRAYAARIRGLAGVRSVAPPADLGDRTWRVVAAVRGDPAGERAQAAVAEIRALSPPFATAVSGPAAEFIDQQEAIASRLLPAALLLAALTFGVLWLMTGSVVLPLKAIVMNALTVGAALSPLVFIYQGGRLEGLLGYTANGGVEATDFLVTAAIVFALSTDYGVFLLGRIKEVRDSGESERESIAIGLARTGRVVTAAAILMAVAIGAFSTSSIPFIQQIGIATAAGVLIDAFVVRTLLVPSLMALLGKWNWWSPRPLRRLHERIGIEETAEGVPTTG